MKRVYLFLWGWLALVPLLIHAQLSESGSYLRDLEEEGYCVIPGVLNCL